MKKRIEKKLELSPETLRSRWVNPDDRLLRRVKEQP